jgi:hypothetical protein
MEIPISLQRCADASPREARILGKLERANKQVQLMSRVDPGKSKNKNNPSDSSSADTSSGDEGIAKRTTRSRQVKLNPKSKNTLASDSSSSADPSSGDEGTTKRITTRSRQVKLNPKPAGKQVSKAAGKAASKPSRRIVLDSDSEDEGKPLPTKRGSAKTQKPAKSETTQDGDVVEVDSSTQKQVRSQDKLNE